MSVYCGDNDGDYYDEWWYEPSDFSVLETKRGRRCVSCNSLIKPNDEVLQFRRFRRCQNDIEERIYGDDVPLASWYVCEDCGYAYKSIIKLGANIVLTKGESFPMEYKKLIRSNHA